LGKGQGVCFCWFGLGVASGEKKKATSNESTKKGGGGGRGGRRRKGQPVDGKHGVAGVMEGKGWTSGVTER